MYRVTLRDGGVTVVDAPFCRLYRGHLLFFRDPERRQVVRAIGRWRWTDVEEIPEPDLDAPLQ